MAEDKTGKHGPVVPAEKKHHAVNFDKALENALTKWSPSDGTEMILEFQASITQNPGGIKEYRIKLNPGG
jgi:hypothetical protein